MLLKLLAILWMIAPISLAAGLVVTTSSLKLQPNASGQKATLYLQNTGLPVEVSGLEFNLQIADGGPELHAFGGLIDGPVITQVDLITNTLFQGSGANVSQDLLFPQLAVMSLDLDLGSITLPTMAQPEIVLAVVTLDTTGFHQQGEAWTFSVNETLNGASRFFDNQANPIALSAPNGMLQITAVPEVEFHSVCMALALACFAWVSRRRSKGPLNGRLRLY